MSIQTYPNGIGGLLGDSLDTCRPLQTTGNVWYVSSQIGVNAASPRGQDRARPLATVAQAQTNATDDDIICCLSGHAETFVAVLSITKRLVIVGEGVSSGVPLVSFTNNSGGGVLFNLTATNVELRNLYFPPSLQPDGAAPKVFVGGASARIRGCYFGQGATDASAGVVVDANGCRIENTTFISIATLLTAQPGLALKVLAGASVTDLAVENCVVSGGAVGFSNYAAIDLSSATSVARANFDNLNLLLGADLEMGTGTTGRVNIQLATGGSRVHWA